MTGPLDPLELALGLPIGADSPAILEGGGEEPLRAVEAAVLGALRRPPCLVSFSGGRDSSAVLAVAARVARREQLLPPVPVTVRVPAARAADESRWQELVISHLGLRDWVRLEFDDELDLIGPVARRALHRHGLLWPFNAHFHVPMLEAAHGGSMLTGIGGDELFRSAMSPHAAAVLGGRIRPVARDLRRVALYLAPHSARREWHARRRGRLHPWLTPSGERTGRERLAEWEAREPRRLHARMRHVRAARYLRVGIGSLARLAQDSDVAIDHPLLATSVWAATARSAPRGGHLSRTDAMRSTFGALLPTELIARGDKACFDEVFFHEHSRAFAAAWPGSPSRRDYVNDTALRHHWLCGAPRAQSFSLLQAAWLASGDDRQEPVGGFVERFPTAGAAQAKDRQ